MLPRQRSWSSSARRHGSGDVADDRLVGGFDGDAELVDGTVRRRAGSWTDSVQLLLSYLADTGFNGAPRPLGRDEQGREVLTHLIGETVGSQRPWPRWTHADESLVQVAGWLHRYHDAVADFVPPGGALWRERQLWRPGLIIAHNDAAPYNAVWAGGSLVGFVDWDMAGPATTDSDVAWVAFAWVPLHARAVVAGEGFTAFPERRRRLTAFLRAYGWEGSIEDVLQLVAERITEQLRVVRAVASAGDAAYERMLGLGRDDELETALRELPDV